METQNKISEQNNNSGLVPLVQSMLSERFAQMNHFGEMNLETIGRAIEEFADDALAGGTRRLRHRKPVTKNVSGLYCEILDGP